MKQYRYREYLVNVLPCIGYGVLCGTLTGILIFSFKLGAGQIEHLSKACYALARQNSLGIVALLAALVTFAFIMSWLQKKIPEARGGGIPMTEGILRGVLSFRQKRTILGILIGSIISFLCGIPLGSEGPAVLMGTAIGALCGIFLRNRSAWNRYVMTGGAAAGFAVATGAPLSAMLFALEEIHKRFTPMLVLSVSMAVLSATYVNSTLCATFGVSTSLFHFPTLAHFDLQHTGYLLLFGLLISLAVGLFDASIMLYGRFTKRISRHFKKTVKLLIVFTLTGILGLCFSDALYSGHETIEKIASENQPLLYLILILLIRSLMMLLVTDSGATGGIFIPTFAIGAAAAAIAAKLLILLGMPTELYTTSVLLGMCAFTGGTLRSPLTAAILFIELTGQFSNLFFVTLVVFIVSFITEVVNIQPFYDRVLEDIEHAQNEGKTPCIACFEMKVLQGAFVVGKSVRDIMWPPSSVVISITRAENREQDMDHDGEKKLFVGDTLILRSRFFDEQELILHLQALVGANQTIQKTEIT